MSIKFGKGDLSDNAILRILKRQEAIGHRDYLRKAYSSQEDKRTLKLDFDSLPDIPVKEMGEFLRIIGPYNRFRPQKVARLIKETDPSALVRVGRHGSPEIYVKTEKTAAMIIALKEADADTVDTYYPGYIRAWWD